MNTDKVQAPDIVSKKLQKEISDWGNSIIEALQKQTNPLVVYETFGLYNYFLKNLPESLKDEADKSYTILKNYINQLMQPSFERQMEEELVKIYRIEKLASHETLTIKSSDNEKLRVIRVVGGLVYMFYITDKSTTQLTSTIFVPFPEGDVRKFRDELVNTVKDRFEPHLPRESHYEILERCRKQNGDFTMFDVF